MKGTKLHFKHEDKLQHFIVGAAMSFFFLVLCWQIVGWTQQTSIYVAIGISVTIAIGFELFSLFTQLGTYDFWDIVWTILGVPLGLYVALVIDYV